MSETLFKKSIQFNRQGPDAPIAMYGGKFYYAQWIIEQMPPHRVYVEPFGGMANVLLKKEQGDYEVFNDADGSIVNFFRVLRDPVQFELFQRLAELTPYSRQAFTELCETPEPTDPVEKAYWFFVRCRQARGGIGMTSITPKAWATSSRSRRKMPEPISKYLSSLDGLPEVAHRFREVVLEHLPALEVLKKYDAPDVLFYSDPPYLPSTRHGGKAAAYNVEMTEADHVLLLQALRQCKGKVMLSGYASPLYDETLSGWRRIERKAKVQVSNSGGERTEVLWMNYGLLLEKDLFGIANG